MPKKLFGRELKDVRILYNVPVTMRDGVTLYADVYRPDDDERYPAVINRTPYLKDLFYPVASYMKAPLMAAAGYNVVIQDVRGTGFSEDGDGGAPFAYKNFLISLIPSTIGVGVSIRYFIR